MRRSAIAENRRRDHAKVRDGIRTTSYEWTEFLRAPQKGALFAVFDAFRNTIYHL